MIDDILMFFFMLPIACEALTQVIGSGSLFKKPREWVVEKNIPFLSELWACKYCISVWAAATLTFPYFYIKTGGNITASNILLTLTATLIVHRISNIWNLVFDIIQEYRINRWLIDLTVKETEEK